MEEPECMYECALLQSKHSSLQIIFYTVLRGVFQRFWNYALMQHLIINTEVFNRSVPVHLFYYIWKEPPDLIKNAYSVH
jgi:hypothetical protein